MDHGRSGDREGRSRLLDPRFQRVAASTRPLYSATHDPGRWMTSPLPLARAAAYTATLARLDLDLDPMPELRDHFQTPRGGLPRNRLCQAVLVLNDTPGAYLRGRHRQAVRTNLRRATEAGLTVRPVIAMDDRGALVDELTPRIPNMAAWSHLMRLRPGDLWWGVFGDDGRPVGVGVASCAGRVAILRTLVVDLHHHGGRYARHLLHAEIVCALGRRGIDFLVVDGPSVFFVDSRIAYFQHLTGYRLYNLRVRFRAAPRPALGNRPALDRLRSGG